MSECSPITSKLGRKKASVNRRFGRFVVVALVAFVGCSNAVESKATGECGSADSPLRVLLVPADGGTQDGTIADFAPIFNAITQEYGIHFDLKVGQSYASVVEGMANKKVDISFLGAVTYHQARERGAAEVLAVGVTNGESVYYSGVFVGDQTFEGDLTELKGRSVAFGDINSTSSFNVPVAMLLAADIDPVTDLAAVYLTGSHTNSLMALTAGKVDAACASFTSFEKAVNNGQIDPAKIRLLAKSDPIPYPPLAMHPELSTELKDKLRMAFDQVHESAAVSADMIRGYGGKRVDRYTTSITDAEFDTAMVKLNRVTDELKAAILKKSAQR